MTGMDEFFRIAQKINMIGGIVVTVLCVVAVIAVILIKKNAL